MADFFDRFSGSGTLDSHTPDSGGGVTWDADGSLITLSGGSIYTPALGATIGNQVFASWTPPSTDYAGAIVVGADWISGAGSQLDIGIILRGSGSPGTKTYYVLLLGSGAGPAGGFGFSFFRVDGGSTSTQIGTGQSFGTTPATNDTYTASVSGTGGTVTLTAYDKTGTQIYQTTDSSGSRITTTGKAGMYVATAPLSGGPFPDQIRAVWAGAIGSGPTAITIAPTSQMVFLSDVQLFALSMALTNETFAWSATHGTTPGSASSTTYTAPASGSTDSVIGTSIDLPTRTATASVTLSNAAATAFTLSGPSSGYNHNASTVFTFKPNGLYTGTLTPTMSTISGSWNPSVLNYSSSALAKTSQFTPTTVGSGNANSSSSPSLTPPSNVAYTSTAQTLAASPSTIANSATTTVTWTGGGTLWLSSAPTFTPTGVAGVSVGSVTVVSNVSAHAVATTGSATGTLTWTDSTTFATTTEIVAVVAHALSTGEGFGPGLTDVGYAIYNGDGTGPLAAWTTTGVAARGAGGDDYGALVSYPADGQDYEVRWSRSNATTPPYAHDVVSSLIAPPTPAAIATAVWTDITAGDFTVATSPGKIIFAQLGGAFTTTSSSIFSAPSLANAPSGGSIPTVSQIATAVWQDAMAGDFTATGSIGKSLFTGGSIPGATGGLFIAGTNAATAITTGLTTHLIGTVDTVTTLTTLPTAPTDWISASAVSAAAVTKIQAGLSTYAGGAVASVTGAVGSVTGAVGSVTAGVTLAAGAIASASFASGATIPRVTLCDTVTTYTGNTPQTGDSFARIGALGAGLTTLAPSATALSTAQWTTARAGYLDNLNIGGPVASQADVLAVNQSSTRHVLLQTVGQYVRPASSTTAYTVESRTYTALDGSAVDADTTPTLTATGSVSGSLAANLSSATNPATGLYRWTYTVTSVATFEQIRFDLSATISSAVYTLSCYTQVGGDLSTAWSSTDATHLTAIFNKLPTNNIADETLLLAAVGSPMQTGSTVVLTDASLTTAKLGTFVLAKTTNITGFTDAPALTDYQQRAVAVTLPTAPTDWISAVAVSAGAVTKIQSGLSIYAGSDTAGTTTLLSRLNSTRAGLLDNLDAAISTRSTFAGGPVASVTAPVTITLSQTGLSPRPLDSIADGSLTIGDCLIGAVSSAAGKQVVSGLTYQIKTPSTGTIIRTFALDSATNPTQRT